MFRNYSHFFEDPQLDYAIEASDLDFANYIKKSHDLIRSGFKAFPNQWEMIAPFELRPENPLFSESNPTKIKYGALLVHGLFDSPFILKDIGNAFQSQGILARSVLLPGHGTVPGSLLNVDFHDWLKVVDFGIKSFKQVVDEIYLIGFSTGGSLGIYHAFKNPEDLAGLITIAPAIKINSSFTFLTKWLCKLGWLSKKACWMGIDEEIDYARYSSFTYNAVYQVYRLTHEIKKLAASSSLKPRLFMGLSADDLIVSTSASVPFFQQQKNPANKLILYAKNRYEEKDPRIVVRSSEYPELNIASFSHMGMPISPANPHYGQHGDFPLASRIDEKNYLYGETDLLHQFYYDLLYKLKLTPFQRRRLTYNPDFDFFVKQMGEFIIFNTSYP